MVETAGGDHGHRGGERQEEGPAGHEAVSCRVHRGRVKFGTARRRRGWLHNGGTLKYAGGWVGAPGGRVSEQYDGGGDDDDDDPALLHRIMVTDIFHCRKSELGLYSARAVGAYKLLLL